MLGVITELELEVTDAYRLKERIERWPWDEAWSAGRSSSTPTATSRSSGCRPRFGRAVQPPSRRAPDGRQCYVKIYDEAADDEPDSAAETRRVDRCYRIYPMVYDPNFHELEYFVPWSAGPRRSRRCAS